MNTMLYSKEVRRVVSKLGVDACRKAYRLHKEGYGAAGIAFECGFETRRGYLASNTAMSAAKAGCEIAKAEANGLAALVEAVFGA